MFLPDNERLIIMDDIYNRLLPDEFAMLADVGVKTIYAQALFSWQKYQLNPGAPLDWSEIDNLVETCRRAGLKALIPFIHSLPHWKPDDWYYCREGRGLAWNIPSYSNPQTAADLDDLAREAIVRYPGGDVQFIFSIPADGEFPTHFFPTSPEINIPHADLVNFVIERNRVLAQQYNEAWTAYHPYTNPTWWDEVYDGLQAALPGMTHNQIVFTYFPHDGSGAVMSKVAQNTARGVRCFVGSEWVSGLRLHVPMLIERGLHGFITAPIHIQQAEYRLTPALLSEIAWAIGELENADVPV